MCFAFRKTLEYIAHYQSKEEGVLMKNRLLKFAESLDHTSKAIQIASGSAELAVEALKKCITDAQILVDEVTLAKQTIDEKDAEISKLQSELARCREENQRLWDENVSIRAHLDAENKKYIESHQATTEGCRVLTPEEVAKHDSEIDPKEAYN
jgi:regulator of replication initiation timing